MIEWFQGFWQGVQGGWIWFSQADGWQPTLVIAALAAALVCIFACLFKTAYNCGRRDAAAPVSVAPRERYIREAEYVACKATQGIEVWNEPIESEKDV